MTRRRVVVLAILAMVAVASTAPGPARAVTAEVGTSFEAWYARLPSVEPRPADTLSVGVALGLEESRSYLALDLTGVDAAEVTGGRLRLPIDVAASRSIESAAIDVCLVGSLGPEVAGSTAEPPAADCSVTTAAALDPDAGELVADLAPFVSSLSTTGLALVPRPAAATDTWRVAIFGRKSQAPGARPIRAALVLPDPPVRPVPSSPATSVPAAVEPPAASTFGGEGNAFASVESFDVAAPVTPAPAEVEPVAVPQLGPVDVGAAPTLAAAPAASPGATPPGSLAFALPLAVLALAGYVASTLTRPALPPPARAPVEPRPAPDPGAGARGPSTGG